MPERTPTTLQHAVESLYQIAVRDAKTTSTKRLAMLASACVDALSARGLPGAEAEVDIPGGGRDKAWDVGWCWRGKYRLVLSLKSILKNISGTVPNRIDDAMGETASIQLYSPEVVTGYVMLFDLAADSYSQKHGMLWSVYLAERLGALSGRRAPYWSPGTFEGHCIIGIDLSEGARLVDGADRFGAMLDTLVEEVHRRNPGIREDLA